MSLANIPPFAVGQPYAEWEQSQMEIERLAYAELRREYRQRDENERIEAAMQAREKRRNKAA